ncbi:MAG: aspartate/glutamate racemase family protein [Chloroflexi bacterium]|nr:aspartate/glutamate racemase family protein [Chloroflexota bacterium]
MTHIVGLVHAVIPAIEPLRATFGQLAPDIKLVNILDEGLITEIDRRGQITPGLVRRLTSLVTLAEEAGAELVLLSCTAYSPVADEVQAQSDIPVLKIDELMVREALGRASKIGVVATVPAGLKMQRQLIERIAADMGREIELDAVLRPEAFQALSAGRRDEHDAIVLNEVEALAARNELVMLAQASMGHLAAHVPASIPVPVLSSPTLAVQKVKELLSR